MGWHLCIPFQVFFGLLARIQAICFENDTRNKINVT